MELVLPLVPDRCPNYDNYPIGARLEELEP
jgi:hypothetical protein